MGTDAGAAADLVITACELVERHGREPFARPGPVAEAVLVRDELRAWAATSPDAVLADDLDTAAGDLDDLLRRLERLPEPAPALTG